MILDTITWADVSEKAVNLSRAVGSSAPNQWGDVLLVQTLLKFIYSDPSSQKAQAIWLGNFDYTPTGHMDMPTTLAIFNFQLLNRNRLYNKALDGRIDAAHYSGRKLRPNSPVMAITLMHILAVNSAMKKGVWDSNSGLPVYFAGLAKVTPKILAAAVIPTKRSMLDGIFG